MDKKTGIILRDLFLEALEAYREDNDDSENKLYDLVGEEIKKAKEGFLLSPDLSPDFYLNEGPDAFEEFLSTTYAIEMCSLIPDASTRAMNLLPILTWKKMDSVVERYLEEASRCYIYGFFLAASIMCRGSIEYSLKKYLGMIESDGDSKKYSIYALLKEAMKRCENISKRDKDIVENMYSAASACIHGRRQIDSEECLNYINYTKLFTEKLFE